MGTLLVQGYSTKTTYAYNKCLEHFTEFIASESREITEKNRDSGAFVGYDCLLRWLQKLRLRGLAERSVQTYLSAVSSWYKWLIRIGKVERNPIDMLPALKLPEKLPKPLAPADTSKLCDEAHTVDMVMPERTKAIVEVLYGTGIRRSELLKLELDDLDLDGPTPYVRIRQGKGGRDGLALLTDSAVTALRAWLEVRAKLCRKYEKPATFKALFMSNRGNHMVGADIYRIIKKLGKDILKKDIYPHQLRHSFGTDLLNNGADLLSIRDLMRHKSVRTTEVYLRVTPERLKDQFKRHPRA